MSGHFRTNKISYKIKCSVHTSRSHKWPDSLLKPKTFFWGDKMKQGEAVSGLEQGLLRENEERNERRKITIDRMLQKWAGEFGRWQLRHFLLASVAWTLEALHTMGMIFADHEPVWRCKENKRLHDFSGNFKNNTWLGFDGCSPAASICSMNRAAWEWAGGSGVSTVSEWDLICQQKYKAGFAQSAFFVGCLLGAALFGHLSDSSLGGKGVLRLVCFLNAVFGFLTAMSPNFWVYLALRLLTGVSTGGVGLSSFVLATEPVGPSKRGPVGMSAFYFFSLGITILPFLSYVSKTWRMLYVVSSIPSLVFSLLVLPFLSESPRWYLVKGRLDEAMDVMRSIAAGNGNHLPDGVSLALDNEEKDDDHDEGVGIVIAEPREAKGSLVEVFQLPLTRTRMVIMVVIWLACAVVYYGLSLNVVNLSTSLYVSVFLNGVAEMPAFALTAVLLEKLGQRAMLVATMLLSGVCAVAGSAISRILSGNPGSRNVRGFLSGLQLACGLLGIFGMAGTYNLLFIYTSELFPTVVRNAALGLCSVAGNVGAIFAPLVVVMATVNPSLPLAVIGAWGIVGGVLAFKLPETLNRPLYETMAGLESGERTHGNTLSFCLDP